MSQMVMTLLETAILRHLGSRDTPIVENPETPHHERVNVGLESPKNTAGADYICRFLIGTEGPLSMAGPSLRCLPAVDFGSQIDWCLKKSLSSTR